MHGILSANLKGPFITLGLRDEENTLLQTDTGFKLRLLALLYFKDKYIKNF